MPQIEQYCHHGCNVFVISELKGKHRQHCLCFRCTRLNLEDRSKSCPIANVLYANAVAFNVVTPVYECPNFDPIDPTQLGVEPKCTCDIAAFAADPLGYKLCPVCEMKARSHLNTD